MRQLLAREINIVDLGQQVADLLSNALDAYSLNPRICFMGKGAEARMDIEAAC